MAAAAVAKLWDRLAVSCAQMSGVVGGRLVGPVAGGNPGGRGGNGSGCGGVGWKVTWGGSVGRVSGPAVW